MYEPSLLTPGRRRRKTSRRDQLIEALDLIGRAAFAFTLAVAIAALAALTIDAICTASDSLGSYVLSGCVAWVALSLILFSVATAMARR
jgi:hypothetical protein